MDDQTYVYCTAALIVGWVLIGICRKSFDPFNPLWLFLAGYFQVYVIQAITLRDWALTVRTPELVASANSRALWAIVWFLVVYHCGLGRVIGGRLPRPPQNWSVPLVMSLTPLLVAWGLACSVLVFLRRGEMSAEESLLFSFPFLMLVGAVLMIVTGRRLGRPPLVWMGVATAGLYAVVWMFNGKRSHPLYGILSAICAFYISKGTRPSKPILAVTAVMCALSVSVALNWRNNPNYERSFSGFIEYLGDFDPSAVLVNLNIKDKNEGAVVNHALASKETEEYGGFLLMLDTVPARSEYDYGANYLRIFSTYIPRIIWPEKPLFGREQWINAWIAGSEFKREADFTGPSIGILGATQLNGGALGTFIVMTALALLLRSAFDHFRIHCESSTWIQAWWPLTFYNAWLMTVNDDPFVWFYYVYGYSMLPVLSFLWLYHKLTGLALGTSRDADAGGGMVLPIARA
jgi:hypothetical protein